MKNEIQKGFPATITFPVELGMLCDWLEKNGYPISGYFELRADDGEAIYWWFRFQLRFLPQVARLLILRLRPMKIFLLM